jgi:predicted transcriptional regulator
MYPYKKRDVALTASPIVTQVIFSVNLRKTNNSEYF